MSQVLKSLQLVTQSYSGTPSTGTGALFASGSALYFENAASTTFPLGLSGGGSGYIIVREYTGSAPGGGALTPTWNNNSNIKYIQVICVGGGGGGGGGCSYPTSAIPQGGSGGGGGAVAWGFFNSASLTQPSYTISIGAGGAGGASRSSLGNGNPGSSGEYTSFGDTLVSASGGTGGPGGVTNSRRDGGLGGSSLICLPSPGFAIAGGTGGGSLNGSALVINSIDIFATPLNPAASAGGGAGGGRATTSTPTSPGTGSNGYEWNTLRLNNTVAGNSGSDDLVTAAVLLQFTSSMFTTTYGLGGGGNGGVFSIAGPAGNGGNGGLYGAGGGGGGSVNSGTTGTGGSGSSGLCIVVEYY